MQSPLRNFLIYLAQLRTGEVAAEQSTKQAVALLTARTLLAARCDSEGMLEVASGYPGYLTRTLGERQIFVPFNLAKVAPNTKILAEVIAIARDIALDANDPICISGSTTFLGVIEAVADLDFCEYYVGEADSISDGVGRLCGLDHLPLIWAKVGDQAVDLPLKSDRIKELCASNPGRLKMDFISNGGLGVLPTTNVILATKSGEDGEAQFSHAYQEAVIFADGPIRQLVSPERLGAYLSFLRGQVSHYASEDDPKATVKALKRVLSLLLFLGYEGTDQVIELLKREEFSLVVNGTRLKELRDMECHLSAASLDRFRDAIQALEEDCGGMVTEDLTDALEAAREYTRLTIEAIDQDFAQYA